MFTSINAVLKQLNAEGWNDITLEYINKGVMTDTYKMHTKTKKYAVRCYPNPRRWLAEVEYSYLIDFAKNGIKAAQLQISVAYFCSIGLYFLV